MLQNDDVYIIEVNPRSSRTVPFLSKIAEKHPDWYTIEDLANMIAIGESTPGPIGVNVATYAGFSTHGVLGGILATLSLVLPSFLCIMIIRFLT